MGYYHCWEVSAKGIEVWKEKHEQIIEDFSRLIPHLPPLRFEIEDGEFTKVFINGEDDGYETFAFPDWEDEWILKGLKEEGYTDSCVKTGFLRPSALPYDLAVRAFLVVARAHLGEDLRVSTDGFLADWALAANLVERELGLYVDVYELLGRRLFLVEAGGGERFLYEGKSLEKLKEALEGEPSEEPRVEAKEELDKTEQVVANVLNNAAQTLQQMIWDTWPFRGPYRVLREVRVPQSLLPALHIEEAAYDPVYRVPEVPVA